MKRLFSLASLTLMTLTAPRIASAHVKELGDVHFGRDLDRALEESKQTNRPVLILFDEIPGCATCQGYGEAVLRHPLIVEAAETLFVPVAIYNNEGGKDAEALKFFGEPSWNNPVVRIVDETKKTIAPRVNGDYTPVGLSRAMVAALESKKRPVPSYLKLFADQAKAEASGTSRAYFSMYCFWTGEACLGDIEGVVATRTGFLQGKETVEVEFDPARLSEHALLDEVKARRCGEVMRACEIFRASEKDDKYNLAQTPWRFVPMTRTQQSRANAYVAHGRELESLFSPRQIALYRAAAGNSSGWKDALHEDDMSGAFARASDLAKR